MLSYITIGADDLPRSGHFYAAVLVPLGYRMTQTAEGIEFAWPDQPDQPPDRPGGPATVYVKHPFNGRAATAGNGAMTAFRAATQALVRAVHAAGVAAGGADEGAPGFRDAYSDHFYVGYLRDPVGNKLAIFCADPAEGRRGG